MWPIDVYFQIFLQSLGSRSLGILAQITNYDILQDIYYN